MAFSAQNRLYHASMQIKIENNEKVENDVLRICKMKPSQ